ncbi:putative deoxycytidylate deaminase [Mycobacterium phage PP]|uniref:Putative deoxycytidylate deaminase n=1 Tax=Mycobacterium phage PP TaxID=2077134 RepID=A0A2Z5XVG3_9CAUD|nr:deoxycytidinylate deaminase [Mycobacterium phage PP]BBC53836.1 putative deoxycytidylate deaminase [Mycobacterium phage PP]
MSSYDDGPTRCVAVHAEANALLYCDREDLVGATIYVTREPCDGCLKLIEAAGVQEVFHPG